jgi:hypothetical protein
MGKCACLTPAFACGGPAKRRLLLTTNRIVSFIVRTHAALGAMVLGMAGCDAFNPAFSSLVAPELSANYATVPNAPGYVVVALQNNVTIDGQLQDWLNPKLSLNPTQIQNLRARIRLQIRITHADNTFKIIEFISGTQDYVDPAYADQAVPDLNQNTLTNVVVPCDVASVELEPGVDIDVFIPVPLEAYERVEIREGDDVSTEFQLSNLVPPQFQALLEDDLDEGGNVVLRRNFGSSDALSPTTNVTCGSVVAIVVNGTLTVPFLLEASSNPSYDQDDDDTVAGIGGRYEFRMSFP